MQSYQEFLQQNLTDRTKQSAFVENLRANDPYFEGMDHGEVARIMANATGFEPLKRFSQPGKISRGLDALGSFVTEGFREITPADYIPGEQVSEGMNEPFSEKTGRGLYNLSRGLGASESTAEAFRMGGQAVPEIVGQMGALLGGVAVAGAASAAAMPTAAVLGAAAIPGTYATMYGQGLGAAYSEGVHGLRAHAVGAIGPVASAASMGLARPMAKMATNATMKIGSKLTGGATAQAIKDAMKIGGEQGLRVLTKNKAVDTATKGMMHLASEAMVEGMQVGLGAGAEVVQEAIIDPNRFVTETMWDKNFWIPTLTSEAIEAVFGTTIGRLRNPLELEGANATEAEAKSALGQLIEDSKNAPRGPNMGTNVSTLNVGPKPTVFTWAEQTEGDTVPDAPADIFAYERKAAEGIDLTQDNTDKELTDLEQAKQQVAGSQVISEHIASVKFQGLEFEDQQRPRELTSLEELESVIATATHGQGDGTLLNTNPAQKARTILTTADEMRHPNVTAANALMSKLNLVLGKSSRAFHDHRLQVDDNTQFAFFNPDTKNQGVFTKLIRGGKAVSKGVALNVHMLRNLAEGKHVVKGKVVPLGKNELSALFETEVTDAEYNAFKQLGQNLILHENTIPLGVSFADETRIPESYRTSMLDFFESSGINAALRASGRKLRFGGHAYTMDIDSMQKKPLDYFASMDRPQHARFFDDRVLYITRGRKYTNILDVHEIGHAVGTMLRLGDFGSDARVEWQNILKRAAEETKKTPTVGLEQARLTAMQMAAAGDPLSKQGQTLDQLHEYSRNVNEMEANLFQHWFLGTENKWSAMVREQFPVLYKIFSDVIASIKKLVTKDTPLDKKLTLLSPETQAASAFFKRLFEANEVQSKNVKDYKVKLMKANGLMTNKPEVDAARTAFSQTYDAALTDDHRRNVTEAFNAWKESIPEEQGGPTESDLSALVDIMSAVNAINASNIDGATEVSGVVFHMPWMRQFQSNEERARETGKRLKDNSVKLKALKDLIKLEGIGRGVDLKVLDDLLLSESEIEAAARSMKGEIADLKVMVDDLTALSKRNMFLADMQYLGRAIGEILRNPKEERVSVGKVAVQLFSMDRVLMKWFLGRLPGQDGIPMNEPGVKGRVAEFLRGDDLAKATKKEDRIEYARKVSKWYPILDAALSEVVSGGRPGKQGYVSFDGTTNFGKKGAKRKARAKYATHEDARSAALVYQEMAEFSGLRLRVVEDTSLKGADKFVIEVTRQTTRSFDETYIDDIDRNEIEEEARELASEVALSNMSEEDIPMMSNADEVIRTKGEELEFVKRSAVVKKFGQRIAKTVKDQADTIVEALRGEWDSGNVPKQLKLIEAEANSYVSRVGQKALLEMRLFSHALTGKMSELKTPKDIALAWVGYKLKNSQKADLKFIELADISSPFLLDFAESMVNYARKSAKVYVAGEVSRNMTVPSDGASPQLSPSALGLPDNLTPNNVMHNKDVASGVGAALNVLPGQRHGGKIKSTGGLVRKILGAPINAAQALHGAYGQGPLHLAQVDPAFKWAGDAIYWEMREGRANADLMIENLFVKGKYDPNAQENFRFKKDALSEIDETSPIFVLKGDPRTDALLNEILLFQRASDQKFETALKSPDLEIRNDAQDILNRMPDDKKAVFQEALERLYEAQKQRVSIMVREDFANHNVSFATMLGLDESFTGGADAALSFAKRFSDMSKAQQFEALVKELNRTPEQAQSMVENWHAVDQAMREKHGFLWSKPWYIDERRFKDYHVSVVFKKGYVPPKSGVKLDPNKPNTGYYDFDKPEDAYAFIEKMKTEGHKVPSKPTDYKKLQYNYKPIEGSYHEIMERVHTTRRMLIQTMLHGEVDPKLIEQIVNILDAQTGDIVAANDVVREGKQEKAKAQFIAGRENLDMVDQFVKSSRRLAAALSRRRTDLIFKLYARDAEMIERSSDMQLMDNFRESMRYQDTDAQRMINKLGFSAFLGLNISSGLVELFQYPMTLAPMLLEAGASVRDAFGIPAGLFGKSTQAALTRLRGKNDASVWTRKDHLALLRTAERMGALNQLKHHDISDNNLEGIVEIYKGYDREGGLKGNAAHLGNQVYGFMNKTYSFFNRINAELSLISAYEVIKKRDYGKDPKQLTPRQQHELFKEAIKLSDMANGSLQRAGRPGWFNTKYAPGRAAGSAFWSLQSFVNALVANQIRFMKKSIDSDQKFTPAERKAARKATVALFGVQLTTMGVMGFTLVPGLGKLVEQVFGFDLEDELREMLDEQEGMEESEKQFYADAAIHGLPAAFGFPIDFQSRMSVQSVGPISSYEGIDAMQLGGPLVGLVEQAFRDLPKVRAGRMKGSEAALNLLPMGLRRSARMAFFDDGAVYDAQKNFMFDPTMAEVIGMSMGFNSMRAKKEMKRRMEIDEATKGDTTNKEAISNAIMRELKAGSAYKAQQMLQTAIGQYGLETPAEINSFVKTVVGHQVDRQYGRNTPEGAGPKVQQAAHLYRSNTPKLGHEQRLSVTDQLITQLGYKPTTTKATLRNARAKDMLQSINPSLTDGMASRLIMRNPRAARIFNTTGQVSSLQGLLSGLDPTSPGQFGP